jgi:hypothetical protein
MIIVQETRMDSAEAQASIIDVTIACARAEGKTHAVVFLDREMYEEHAERIANEGCRITYGCGQDLWCSGRGDMYRVELHAYTVEGL